MALNFPNSPTNGQIYTDGSSGNRWVWDAANTAWISTSTFTQTITVASTAPGTPVVGQLWWNQDYGRLLVYYSDGSSSQWVDASPSDATSALAYGQANTVFGVANAAFGVANTALQNTNVTLAGNLTVTGNVVANKQVIVTYTPATSVNAAITLAGANTQGGTGYVDFLKASNLSGGTNPHKTFRLNSTGGIEVINSAYSAILLSLDDSGRVTMPYQPLASVRYDGASKTSSWIIIYDIVMLNNGSHYNNTNGRFTCPVAGYYRVTANDMSTYVTDSPCFLQVYKNGGSASGIGYGRSGAGAHNHASIDAIVLCAAGDYLQVYSGANQYGGGYNHATFQLIA
jgi:hypothetical protein